MCGDNVKRPKRQSSSSGVKDDDGLPATIEVYSGLYVNENNDSSESDDDSVFRERVCINLNSSSSSYNAIVLLMVIHHTRLNHVLFGFNISISLVKGYWLVILM